MDEKLENYRAKVKRKEFFDKIKQRLIRMVTFAPETNNKKDETIEIPDEKVVEETESGNDEATIYSSSEDEGSVRESVMEKTEGSKMKYIVYGLWFCFWATCWMIAIEMKFGTVFLMFSALFGIYFNTRTGKKRKGEVSAYSVFNENCESIKGTLNAEQLTREMVYGPLAVQH